MQSCNIHHYADNTVMYAIALSVARAMLELQSDFVALQKALVDLKRVLNAGKTKYMLFFNSQKKS